VLVIGMKGLGAEISKNLILAGVKSLTMMDHENAEPEDMHHQFFIPNSDIGKNVNIFNIFFQCIQNSLHHKC